MVCEEGNMMHHEVASSDLSEIPERWEGNIVNLEADSPLKDLSISDPPVKARLTCQLTPFHKRVKKRKPS